MPIPPVPSSDIDASWVTTADRDTLGRAVIDLSRRVAVLEERNAALGYAAESFGALADRLNTALRAMRATPPTA